MAFFDTIKELSIMQLNLGPIRRFQEKTVPANARLVGWSALVQESGVRVPVRRTSVVSESHIRGSRREEPDWNIFDKRYWPGEDFGSHLAFALRHENVDPLILKRLFQAVPQAVVEQFVRNAPTGVPNRRGWFWYEFLTGRTLDIPELPSVAAIDLLDEKAYFTGTPQLSKRHKVRDNLLGTPDFCPIIRRTKPLTDMVARQLGRKATEIVGRTGAHVVARAASFLLLADSRASFAIEGERPPRGRLERWARAVLQAGKTPLTLDEIIRLHGILIEDTRFVRAGLRPDGVFLGERDDQGDPLPEFIGARAQDLDGLMTAMIEANNRMKADAIDPVLQATATSFGFVYIHPFQDGNGRLHRCLIHHVLAERRFSPVGMVFPVSSVMLARIETYRDTLRAHSGPLMTC
ncbi:MAG TPA: Fic family protein, partial [Acidobacteriaceae bacterium]